MVIALHRGRTDGNGGHYDHSIGEYHYHHGYSAHDHYDIDGDGKKDCPYDFKDKTDHSPNNSQSNNNWNNYGGDQPILSDTEEDKNDVTFWDIIKATLTIIIILFAIALVSLLYLPIFANLIILIIEKLLKLCFKKEVSETTYNRILISIYVLVSILIVIITTMSVLTDQGII